MNLLHLKLTGWLGPSGKLAKRQTFPVNIFRHQWRTLANRGFTYLIIFSLGFNLVGCSTPDVSKVTPPSPTIPEPTLSITEVSPPVAVQKLHSELDQYQPQVTIVSPQPDEVLQDNTVNIQLDVQNLPIFQENTLGLGPHLQVILDNQPAQAIYDLEQPLTFEDLEPGTHTLRVFAAYPWDESYKNEAAYDQTVFHLFTRTPSNNPNLSQPLLTLNQPTKTYGAEPILLDFYLSRPTIVAANSEEGVEDRPDWQIQMTLNGERFLIDQWQPIYIKGVKSGKNWIQLQYLDSQGQPLNNVYNNSAKVFTYNPDVSNSLSQLFKGELSASQLQAIVDPDYISEISTPVPEAEELEEPIEPSVLEENYLEESEPISEESTISPVEDIIDETEDSVEEIIEEEAIEEDSAVVEPIVEEELPETSQIEADESDTAETVTEEAVEEATEEDSAVVEPIVEEELPEVNQIEADNSDAAEITAEEPMDEPLIKIDETSETPIVIEEPLQEETVIEEEFTDIPEEIVEVNETLDVVAEDSPEELQLEQPESEGWFNSIKKRIQLPFFKQESVEVTQPQGIESMTIPEDLSNSEQTTTKKAKLRAWFDSVLKRIQLPFSQAIIRELI